MGIEDTRRAFHFGIYEGLKSWASALDLVVPSRVPIGQDPNPYFTCKWGEELIQFACPKWEPWHPGVIGLDKNALNPHAAVLWALCWDRGDEIEVGKCPTCMGTGKAWVEQVCVYFSSHHQALTACNRWMDYKAVGRAEVIPKDSGWQAVSFRQAPCTDCQTSGRHIVPIPELIWGYWVERNSGSRDPLIRDALEVFAAKCEDAGDPLGPSIMFWLMGQEEGSEFLLESLKSKTRNHVFRNPRMGGLAWVPRKNRVESRVLIDGEVYKINTDIWTGHPKDYTPAFTTELREVARFKPLWDKEKKCKLVRVKRCPEESGNRKMDEGVRIYMQSRI